jgi:hypothetical protein
VSDPSTKHRHTAREIAVFKLQKDVPIPDISRSSGRKAKYPFNIMEVKDSFFIPGAKPENVSSAILRFLKTEEGANRKFTTRTMKESPEEGEPEVEGVRIWRTE